MAAGSADNYHPVMAFFAIAIALLLEQVRPLAADHPAATGLRRWLRLVGRNVDAGGVQHGWLAWVLAVFCGAVVTLDFAWLVADTLNALMAIPNLLSLLLRSPVIVQLTREYFSDQQTNN